VGIRSGTVSVRTLCSEACCGSGVGFLLGLTSLANVPRGLIESIALLATFVPCQSTVL
jgi:hypothetical protein